MQSNEGNRQNEGPIHLAFLHVLAFPGTPTYAGKNKFEAILEPFGRFGVPCWRPLDFEGVPKSKLFI